GPRLHGSLAQFGAPAARLDLPADPEFRAALRAEGERLGLAFWEVPGEPLDHGATVPLWYLADAGWQGPTVVVGLNYPGEGGLESLGRALAQAAARLGRRVAVVASGDLSHRLKPGAPSGYDPRAGEFDRAFISLIREGRYPDLRQIDPALQDLAAEDAVDSTTIALAATGWSPAGHAVLSYEGPFGVGYGVAVLHQDAPSEAAPAGSAAALADDGQILLETARRSVEAALQHREKVLPTLGRPSLADRHPVFVTLRQRASGALRGCVGTLTPQTRHVLEEVWEMAREAAFADRRFPPVQAVELPGLAFEVSVLSPLEAVESPDQLDPRRHGVVVRAADGRRGALLPGLPGVDTPAQQVEFARRKAGLGPGEPVRLERFTVRQYREPGPGE
ncbi:MAG: AmmeMemoRadiSam system protein A, partial [Verrucomicrobiota bacterium]